jgi:hypothetical protein
MELVSAPVDGVIVNSVTDALPSGSLSIKMCEPVKSEITGTG